MRASSFVAVTKQLICGIDSGATSCKGVIASVEGSQLEILSSSSGASGNANVIGEEGVASNLTSLVQELAAEAQRRPEEIEALVLGGASPGSGDQILKALMPEASGRVFPDQVVMFRSGSEAPAGVVVIAGTGSSAARISEEEPLQRAGGWGWGLGDEGSGTWLGRRCLQVVLEELDGGEPTLLRELIAAKLGVANNQQNLQSEIFRYAYRDGIFPVKLSALAPLVSEAADQEDAVALAILFQAVETLARLADQLLQDGDDLVFGGSVASRLAKDLLAYFPDRPVAIVSDGLNGALWLAARELGQRVSLADIQAAALTVRSRN